MDSSKSMEVINCINCGEAVSGQFCGNCGQKRQGRISFQYIKSELIAGLFNYDSPGMKTLVDLTVRPSVVYREYLEGARARYLAPIRYSFFVLAVLVAVAGFTDNTVFTLPSDILDGPSDEKAIGETYMAFINAFIIPITFVQAFLVAAIFRLFFRKEKYTIIELYVPTVLNTVHFTWTMTVAVAFGIHSHPTVMLVMQLISLVYFAWGMGGIYTNQGAKRYVKAFFAYVVALFCVMVLTAVPAFIMGVTSAIEKV